MQTDVWGLMQEEIDAHAYKWITLGRRTWPRPGRRFPVSLFRWPRRALHLTDEMGDRDGLARPRAAIDRGDLDHGACGLVDSCYRHLRGVSPVSKRISLCPGDIVLEYLYYGVEDPYLLGFA